jgi:hypothetical protein
VKDLAVETRLDVIYRVVTEQNNGSDSVLAHEIENALREWDLYHALKRWQQGQDQ